MRSDLKREAALAVTRRHLLQGSGLCLGSLALGGLLQQETQAAGAAGAAGPHFAPKAKRIIYLHMIGAPSQLDLFDYKPALKKYDGEECPPELVRGKRFAFIGDRKTLAASQYAFKQHGQSGQSISELLPHLAGMADEITVIRSLRTEEINHAPAQMFLHSGFGRWGRPGLGSWLVYGLGSGNRDLPAYVVLLSGPAAGAGTSLWSSGFLPSQHQGVQFRSGEDPVHFLSNPNGHSTSDRRRLLDAVRDLNREHLEQAGDPEIAARISQYELAFRMQSSVPELMDLTREDPKVLERYGAAPGKPSFAANCLLARRLVERGVRVVQLFDSDWDHHGNLEQRLPAKCRDVDQGMAALLADLKERGLLADTLVVWGAEFGRTPLRQGADNTGAETPGGRDHQRDAYTIWMAGAGVKPGLSYGATDELGFNPIEKPVHIHDLNATLLHLMGLDHERLTYRYQGREFRLTDVHGSIVRDILA